MPKDQIITNQHIHPEMKRRAVDLRQNMTPSEKKLWQGLRAGRLEGYHFRRQQIIDSYIVDFYCHSCNLVVELDGDVHKEQKEYDHERDANLEARGLQVLRFSNSQVNQDVESVLGFILAACREGERFTHS